MVKKLKVVVVVSVVVRAHINHTEFIIYLNL